MADDKNQGLLERHIQTIGMGLVLASIIWLYASVWPISGRFDVVDYRLGSLEEQIKSGMVDRFTGAQGLALEQKIVVIGQTLIPIEERLRQIETVYPPSEGNIPLQNRRLIKKNQEILELLYELSINKNTQDH